MRISTTELTNKGEYHQLTLSQTMQEAKKSFQHIHSEDSYNKIMAMPIAATPNV